MNASQYSGHDYLYQLEKMRQATSALMAPHAEGEDRSFAHAFNLCGAALRDLRIDRIDDPDVHKWIQVIKDVLNKERRDDPMGIGTHVVLARSLSDDEKKSFSNAVREWTWWLCEEFYSDNRST